MRNLFRQYQPFRFREMGPLYTPFIPPSRVLASHGALPLSVGTAQKLLLGENLLFSAKLLSRSILFRRRQKRGEPADGLSSRGGERRGWRGRGRKRRTRSLPHEDVGVPYRSRYGIPFVFVCRRVSAAGRMLYASQIGAERNAYDR